MTLSARARLAVTCLLALLSLVWPSEPTTASSDAGSDLALLDKTSVLHVKPTLLKQTPVCIHKTDVTLKVAQALESKLTSSCRRRKFRISHRRSLDTDVSPAARTYTLDKRRRFQSSD